MRKIIWALDPYNSNKKDLQKAALYVEKLARDLDAMVEPTFILSPNTFYLPTDYLVPPSQTDFLYAANSKMSEVLTDFHSQHFLPGRILYDESYTLRKTASTFIDYAHDEKALFIFATTHARKGVPRFWLGSFVETLIIYATVPIVSLNPKAKSSLKVNNIIFPTDLTLASKKSLMALLPQARKLGARIHLLHVMQSFRVAAALAAEGLSEVAYGYYYKEVKRIKKSKEHKIQTWAKLCRSKGVPTSSQLSDSQDQILDVILQTVKNRKANLIAMASTSGPMESIITGGIARQVARYAECPVWISHQFNKKKTK